MLALPSFAVGITRLSARLPKAMAEPLALTGEARSLSALAEFPSVAETIEAICVCVS